jgi:hypothetical protein
MKHFRFENQDTVERALSAPLTQLIFTSAKSNHGVSGGFQGTQEGGDEALVLEGMNVSIVSLVRISQA